jgi:hypothetical protein
MPHASRIKLFDCSADRVASPETCKTINQLLKEGYVLNQEPVAAKLVSPDVDMEG